MSSAESSCILDNIECKRIDQIRLLVVGMDCLGATVVKEAVKAGFMSVTMMDHLDWSSKDRPSQFLIPPEVQHPSNRAKASQQSAQNLNPLVQVHVETRQIEDVTEEFFRNRFEAVVAAGLELPDILKLNMICRKLGMKFFAGNVFGTFGYFFSDLLDNHVYYKKTRGLSAPHGGKHEKTVICCLKSVPFQNIINHQFDSMKSFLDVSPFYFIMRGLLKFRQKWGCSPENEEEDLEKFKDLINEEVKLSYNNHYCNGYYEHKHLGSYVKTTLGTSAPAIAHLIGTMLNREVIRAVTHFDHPNHNLYFFNPVKNKSEVVTILS